MRERLRIRPQPPLEPVGEERAARNLEDGEARLRAVERLHRAHERAPLPGGPEAAGVEAGGVGEDEGARVDGEGLGGVEAVPLEVVLLRTEDAAQALGARGAPLRARDVARRALGALVRRDVRPLEEPAQLAEGGGVPSSL